MYAKWIQSWRDLPILINQWANVVRWEKVTRLFLRTTEFLWQEGHTAHENGRGGRGRERGRCSASTRICRDRAGDAGHRRPEDREREIRRGRSHVFHRGVDARRPGAAGGTSHNLGQNFLEELRDQFQARDKSLQYAWTTSVGCVDADDRRRDHDARRRRRPDPAAAHRPVSGRDRPDSPRQLARDVLPKAQAIRDDLVARGVRVMLDDRDSQTPGWKFNEWEMRGVPLRLEIGPKDLEKSQVVLARRDTREKSFVPMDGLTAHIEQLLVTIQQALFDRAVQFRTEHTSETSSYDEFKQIMDGRPGFVISPWCGTAECEAAIKAETQATIRNIPFTSTGAEGKVCIKCGKQATANAWFAKSY
jgi:prolyl-tRNA synthetase